MLTTCNAWEERKKEAEYEERKKEKRKSQNFINSYQPFENFILNLTNSLNTCDYTFKFLSPMYISNQQPN